MSGHSDDLWAITAYFNAAGFARRRENYRRFRQHLNVPLLAVELAYGQDFELGPADAEILIQFRGRDVLWQKERLLNLALQALPPSCTKVVWLDCDIIFESPDWSERARRRLDDIALLQPFSHARFLPSGWLPGCPVPADARLRHPPACLIAMGASPAAAVAYTNDKLVQMDYTPGMAWAARREVLRHGLYDACVVGGGDGAIMRAAFGFAEMTTELQAMNPARREHYLAWAAAFHDAVRGGVGFVDGDILHLWHGHVHHRRYLGRHRDFEPFGFDPATDIAVDDNGGWRWNSDKPDMHAFVRDYFASRNEDG